MKHKKYCFDETQYYEFVDNELTAEASQKIKDHLLTCRQCREFVREIEDENEGLRSLFGYDKEEVSVGEFSPNLEQRVMETLEAKPAHLTPGFRRLLAYVASIFIVLLSAVAILLFTGKGQPGGESVTYQPAHEVLLRSASVEGQATQVHIFEDKDQDVKYIWLEKI